MIPIIKEYNSDGKESYFEDANGEFIIIGTNSYGKLINFYCSTNKMYKDNVQTLNNIADSLIMVETKASVGRFDSASFNNETKTLTLKRSTFKETIKFNDNYLPIQWENSIGAKEITEYDNKGREI
jgi:predicted KAP-like P-loop ATPase